MVESDERFVLAKRMQCADASDRNSGDLVRDALSRRGREEKFVVFASVEGGMESFVVGEPAGERVKRDGDGVYFSPEVGGLAKVSEISRESVAEVDGGMSESSTQKVRANGETGLGEEVGVVG
jgi:hypothetical protein